MPHSAASAICAPTNARRTGSWTDEAAGRPGSRSGPARGPRASAAAASSCADRAEQQRRGEERDGVDGDGDRRGQDLDEEAADAEGHELGGGAARRQRAVRLDQPLALDDRRQVGVVGGVEERRQDRRPARTRRGAAGSVRTPSANATGIEPSSDRPPEVGPDEDRPAPQPVDPGAGDEPEDERRAEVEAAQDGDLERARARAPGWRRAAARSG